MEQWTREQRRPTLQRRIWSMKPSLFTSIPRFATAYFTCVSAVYLLLFNSVFLSSNDILYPIRGEIFRVVFNWRFTELPSYYKGCWTIILNECWCCIMLYRLLQLWALGIAKSMRGEGDCQQNKIQMLKYKTVIPAAIISAAKRTQKFMNCDIANFFWKSFAVIYARMQPLNEEIPLLLPAHSPNPTQLEMRSEMIKYSTRNATYDLFNRLFLHFVFDQNGKKNPQFKLYNNGGGGGELLITCKIGRIP